MSVGRPGEPGSPVIELRRVSKTYGVGQGTVHAVREVSLTI